MIDVTAFYIKVGGYRSQNGNGPVRLKCIDVLAQSPDSRADGGGSILSIHPRGIYDLFCRNPGDVGDRRGGKVLYVRF